MQRRSFLAAILAGASAPAIVRAGSLMRINPRIDVLTFKALDRYGPFQGAQYITHVGVGFGLAQLRPEGSAVWYNEHEPHNALGLVVNWDNRQKLPPGWEFCDSAGVLLPA